MRTDIIFDTDAGSDVDDLYALALILSHPHLNLLGVTTVGKDTQARARLIAKMLRLGQREDVPVYAGIGIPPALRERGVDESRYMRLTHTQFVGSADAEHGRAYGDAVEFMLHQLSQAQTPITIVGTGPWTNIAALLNRVDAEQRSMIGSLSLMGGEVRLLHAEANIRNDPEAADLVLKSRLPIFLGTWSATRELFFTMADVAALTSESSSPFICGLRQATDMWWGKGMRSKPGPVCYDVIPVFWAAGEQQAISCIKLDSIPVELAGSLTRGMLMPAPNQVIRAERTHGLSSEYITVSGTIDAAALKQRFTELVFRRETV